MAASTSVAVWLALSSTNALQVEVLGGLTRARPSTSWRRATASLVSANNGDDAGDDRLQQFRAWLEAKGVVDEATPVRAERRDGWGLCLTSGRDISTGDVLLQVPRMLRLRPAMPGRVGFLNQSLVTALRRCRVRST